MTMCTSFAAYFGKPIYAMNIDHPDRERKFKITTLRRELQQDTVIRFHCQNREDNEFLDSVCMNSLGMFSNYQFLLYNKNEPIIKPTSNSISDGNLFSQSQMYVETVKELLKRMRDKTFYYRNSYGAYKLHNLYADKEGDAVIIEARENGNAVSPIHDQYLVMTNFPAYEFDGKPYNEVYGDGSDRYKIACEELIKHKNYFGVEQAFGVLKKTQHSSDSFPTVCSMVFDPIRLFVYLVLYGKFEKIWRISITEKIIESYVGFKETYRLKIGAKGILASELETYW